ncbi:hypothetical protein K474DRAFT_122056 [Panus rudis PR-1116 ss-1]|nr:hypothetical protein K474DRAFT_122056 [Panus rudis PR-1116 ss-1]
MLNPVVVPMSESEPQRSIAHNGLSLVPTEIFEYLCTFLYDDKNSLSSATLVSRSWERVLRRHLFSSISIHVDRFQTIKRFRDFVCTASGVQRYIAHLSLDSAPYNKYHFIPDFNELTDIVDSLPNLRDLSITWLWLLNPAFITSTGFEKSNRCLRSLSLNNPDSGPILYTPHPSAYMNVISCFSHIDSLRVDLTDYQWQFNRDRRPLPKPPRDSIHVGKLCLIGWEGTGIIPTLSQMLDKTGLHTVEAICRNLSFLSELITLLRHVQPHTFVIHPSLAEFYVRPNQGLINELKFSTCTFLRKLHFRVNKADDGYGYLCNWCLISGEHTHAYDTAGALAILLYQLPPTIEEIVIELHFWTGRDLEIQLSLYDFHVNEGVNFDWRKLDIALAQHSQLRSVELLLFKWRSYALELTANPSPLSDSECGWFRERLRKLDETGRLRFSYPPDVAPLPKHVPAPFSMPNFVI